jgi:hypothetical protein
VLESPELARQVDRSRGGGDGGDGGHGKEGVLVMVAV